MDPALHIMMTTSKATVAISAVEEGTVGVCYMYGQIEQCGTWMKPTAAWLLARGAG